MAEVCLLLFGLVIVTEKTEINKRMADVSGQTGELFRPPTMIDGCPN